MLTWTGLPADPFLRLMTPLQALFGFVLLTSAISWILQVHPVLGRRRSVAKRLSVMESSGAASVVAEGHLTVASRLLDGVTDGVIQVETDLLQYAESYYFLERKHDLSLAATLPHALDLAAAGTRSSSPKVRQAATMLRTAVDSLAGRLDGSYLRTGTATAEVLRSYRADHGFDRPA